MCLWVVHLVKSLLSFESLQMIKRRKWFPDVKDPAKVPVSLHALPKSLRSLYFHFPTFRRDEAGASSKKLYLIAVYYLNSKSVNLH